MEIFTIGFTQKGAKNFFGMLKDEKIKKLYDVRIHNASQLAGFAKKNDLEFFLKEICDADYFHFPELAPTKELFNEYKKGEIIWEGYSDKFLNLISQRNVERILKPEDYDESCLLCSEHEPHFCHRRLVAEYLNEKGFNLKIKHLY
ncbi:MAG: hypothetical protein CMP02_06410 [Woeseiaceae bacterium]|nr:hypothetical protein [Woeseiaceae bacterium]|tara:strand:- start:3188 stop:3625 length:438 start_codon:yes stop_codon:yes gene_type:complete